MIHDKFGSSYVFDRSGTLMRAQKVFENGEFFIARFRLSPVSPLFMQFIPLCSPCFWIYVRRYDKGNYEIYNYSARTWNDFQIRRLTNDWSFRDLADTEIDDTPESWFSVVLDSLRGCKK